MLEMRPNCERCDRDLAAGDVSAFICSFECTYCTPCTEGMERVCPNCGGTLVPRPTRVGEALAKFPASTKRVLKT